jgi:hypothetical protein
VLTALLALTACGSAKHTGGASPAGSTPARSAGGGSTGSTTTSTTANNGEAGFTADVILADAQQASGAASSVHVSGTGISSGTPLSIDAVLAPGGHGGGQITDNGATLDIVLDGQVVYIKATAANWSKLSPGIPAAAADLLGDKWLKTTTSNKDFSDLASGLDISQFMSNLQPTGTVTKEPITTFDGVSVIPLKDNSDGGLLYVASQGTPYIIASTGGTSSDHGVMHFSQYNSATVPSPPSGAVDLNALESQAGTG